MLYHAAFALLGTGVVPDVTLDIAADGTLTRVAANTPPAAGASRIDGLVLPGMANVHGHAFQRAMAGLTEWDKAGADNFWSWRDSMYRFAARLTPESQRAIAAWLYVEQVKSGYTAAAEFHYLHHKPDGAPHAPPTAMMDAIIAAADESGIMLTLLPTLYMTGGADGRPLNEGQKRFGNTLDQFFKLSEAARKNLGLHKMGLAFHSLRAVPAAAVKEAIAAWPKSEPIHIHAAEQAGEIEECVAQLKQRPVEFLLSLGADARWCLIHSTHMTDEETAALARSKAVAGLCPTTEANLGDGIFPLADYLKNSGRFAIGGDSHVSTDPAEELRALEYSQRLKSLKRNVAASHDAPHTGARLWALAARGGAQALGLNAGEIKQDARADLVVIDASHVSLAGRAKEFLLDSYVFTAGRDAVRDVMVGGKWLVRNRRHPREDALRENYLNSVKSLA